MKENVVGITDWLKKNQTKIDVESFNHYLDSLSFGQLITESKELVHEINTSLNGDVARRSRLLIDELNKRITSKVHSKSLEEIKVQGREKISNLEALY